MEHLLDVLLASRKRELRVLSGSLVVHKRPFVSLIVASELRLIPFRYRQFLRDVVPSHLEPTVADFEDFGRKTVEPRHDATKKAIVRMVQASKDRRLLTGHLFLGPELSQWHFFYFDQRDTARRENHWRHGSHIHFINHLCTSAALETVVGEFLHSRNPRLTNSLHLRHADTDRRCA